MRGDWPECSGTAPGEEESDPHPGGHRLAGHTRQMVDGPADSLELIPTLLAAPQMRLEAPVERAGQSAVEELGDAHLDLLTA